MAISPVKRANVFQRPKTGAGLLPEDLKNITDPLAQISVPNPGVTSQDFVDLNDNTDAQIGAVMQGRDANREFALIGNEIDQARLQTKFAFNMEDLALAKEAGIDAINSGAAQRGLIDSGIRLDDQTKFSEEVARKEGRLEIGLGLDAQDMALGLAQMLNNIDLQALFDAGSIDQNAFTFMQSLINSSGGGTASSGGQTFGSAYNYSLTPQAQQQSQEVAGWAQNISKQFGDLKIASHQRDPEYNKKIGGATNSDHIWGGAIDFSSSGGKDSAKLDELYAYLQNYIGKGIRTVIWRQPDHYDHLHVSFQGGTDFKLPDMWADPQSPVSPSNNDSIKASSKTTQPISGAV